jgi:hypothetical protein
MRNITLACAVLLFGLAAAARLDAHYGWVRDAALRRPLRIAGIVAGLAALALVGYLELTSR